MKEAQGRPAAVLWTIAAVLGLIAFGISVIRGEPNWAPAAFALFLVVMGISAWRRS